jgi:hypothetical protein
MPTILKDQVFDKAHKLLDTIERELSLFKDGPSIAPEHDHYAFENGTPYEPPTKAEAAFIPDNGFDGPA